MRVKGRSTPERPVRLALLATFVTSVSVRSRAETTVRHGWRAARADRGGLL
jgi:hypothetical protein